MGVYIHSPVTFLILLFLLFLAFDMWGEAIKLTYKEKVIKKEKSIPGAFLIAILLTALFFVSIHFLGYPLSSFEGQNIHIRGLD